MPPELATALEDHETRWKAEQRSERCLAALTGHAGERPKFIAGVATLAAADFLYVGCRRRIEDAFGRSPGIFVVEIRFAVTSGTYEICSRIGLAEDAAQVHNP